jgi:hypothetical protein
MSKHRCYRFAYPLPGHKDRELLPFQLRDGEGGLFMREAVAAHGYAYAGPIINYPSSGPDLIPFDDGRLRETDVILLTTRPPMDDRNVGDKKGIRRGYTTLEEKLLEGALRRYFARCARSEVLLTDEIARISPEIARRQSCMFRQNGGAMYYSYGSPTTGEWRHFKKDPQPLTAAFLVYEEHAWPGGPALLAAFGMGGTETLVWSYFLATRLSHLLFTTSFAMAELRAPLLAEPPTRIDLPAAWEGVLLGVAQPKPGRGPRRAA